MAEVGGVCHGRAMSNFDAVADAVELMRVWSERGADAADEHVSHLEPERHDALVFGLVNLLGSVLAVREKEQGVTPGETLEELVSMPWGS